MNITGVSNSTSYDEWKLIQAEKEMEQKNAKETGAASGAQVTATENTSDTLSQTEKVLNITNTDTVEISDQGRAYQDKRTEGENIPKMDISSDGNTNQTSTDLSTLTEDEIQELVDNGTITRAEANTELARRSASDPNS